MALHRIKKQDFEKIFREKLPFQPTEDQDIAIDKLSQFLVSENDLEVFILTGYAGTGKTSLISTFVQTLSLFKLKSVLLAPTGRAAKVLSSYSGKRASTIHRKIYFVNTNADGMDYFAPGENRHKDTLFIVDEASMIAINAGIEKEGGFSNRDLLADLMEYVYSSENCKLIFVGDQGQLPPVGLSKSPALDKDFLEREYDFKIFGQNLSQIVRQEGDSGILDIAGQLRSIEETIPRLLHNSTDARAITGMELQDELESCISNYGRDEVMVVTRSNKRANLFNQQIRHRILWQEDDINAGDVIMSAKNNYFWLDSKTEAGFIANGELMEIIKINRREHIFGGEFADVVVRLIDYPGMKEVEVKILLNAINYEGPSLPRDIMKELFYRIAEEEYPLERDKRKRNQKVMNNPYFQALQVKFGYAVTCHKAQGGQWSAVFVDPGYFVDDMWNQDYMRWLYTAVTRATDKLYLVNFPEQFVGQIE